MDYRTQDGILRDISKSGKDRKWKDRKIKSLELSYAFYECCIGELIEMGYCEEDARIMAKSFDELQFNQWLKKQDKTGRCAETLEFVRTDEGRLKLYRAWFCKDRLCPMCNWRRAMKFTTQIAQILQVMKERNIKGKPIFLTLTMKNVKGEEIGDSFSDFAESFHRLMMYKAVKKYCLGAIRTSEVTYNSRSDTYNTHIHCLLWMSPSYYDGKAYLSQAKWTELWKRAARLDYTPVVNVKAVKPKEPTESDPTGLFKAVLEVAKYPVKPDAFGNLTGKEWGEETAQTTAKIRHLEKGMYKKRLISFFGIFKEIRKELQLDDVEDGDLVGAEESAEDKGEEIEIYSFDHQQNNYFRTGN